MESTKEGSLQNKKKDIFKIFKNHCNSIKCPHVYTKVIDVIICYVFRIAGLICYTQSFTKLWLYSIYCLVSILARVYGPIIPEPPASSAVVRLPTQFSNFYESYQWWKTSGLQVNLLAPYKTLTTQ